jgi:gliding motility-associated-like protein
MQFNYTLSSFKIRWPLFFILFLFSFHWVKSQTNPANPCSNYLYKSNFYKLGNISSANLVGMSNGDIFFDGGNNQDFLLVKLNSNGDTVWSKIYQFASPVETPSYVATKTILDYDNKLFSIANGNSIIKTDTSGNIIYSKQIIPLDNRNWGFTMTDMYMLPDGNKVFLFYNLLAGGFSTALIVECDKDLNSILWSKVIRGGFTYVATTASISVVADKIILFSSFINGITTDTTSELTMFNENGSIVQQHFYKGLYGLDKIGAYNNGYFLLGSSGGFSLTPNPPSLNSFYVRTDASLNVKSDFTILNTANNRVIATAKNDGSIIFYNCNAYYAELFKLTSVDQLSWCDSVFNFYQFPTGILATTNGIYFAGSSGGTDVVSGQPISGMNIYMTDNNGNFTSCIDKYNGHVYLQTRPYTIATQVGFYYDSSVAQITSLPSDKIDGSGYQSYNCKSIINCNQLSISGNTTVCANSAVYQAQKNAGCSLPVLWSLRKEDSTSVVIQYIDQTSTSLNFKNSGNYKLYGSIYTSCDTLADSLSIHVNIPGQQPQLGNDTVFCIGNSLMLHAGNSYQNYLWQDGSTDSTLFVSSTGKYYVTVNDYCNNTFSDTININVVQPAHFAIPADTTICISDTVFVNSLTAFSNISVQPQENVSISGTHIAFYPVGMQNYTVQAMDNNGCISKENIAIHIFPSSKINLGNDTSVCSGDSIVLDAGPDFVKYAWSNGSTNEKIIIKQADVYNVIATDVNACIVKDTFRLLQVYDLPVINLDTTSLLCYNSIRRLFAGDEFVNYLWSDGSSNNYLDISTTGKYWVKVEDKNTCVNSDTALINRILPLPSEFLAKEDSICRYGNLTLYPTRNFSKYLWSDNSASSSITISTAGTYWLQVTDSNNCIGTDTLTVVEKQCLEGFYIPNAFTPNGDGINDVFRPLLFGDVSSFKFEIFNRWGQKVFFTTKLMEGWNGNVNGILQNAGTFVWACTYQLKGNAVQHKKGTVVLVR